MMRLKITLFSIIYLLFVQQALAAGTLDRRIDAATEVLEDLAKMPEKGIPPSLLSSAYAVAVIPNSIKAGFIIGGSFGRGILVVRQADGGWSNPTFVSMGGGSLGWQVGAQSSDLVIVFKNRKGVDNIANGKIKLGADASIAAGPVGRYTSAATDGRLRAEIYSYSRNRGLFAGVSLEGAWMRMDNRANFAYYDSGQGNAASHSAGRAHAQARACAPLCRDAVCHYPGAEVTGRGRSPGTATRAPERRRRRFRRRADLCHRRSAFTADGYSFLSQSGILFYRPPPAQAAGFFLATARPESGAC